MADEVDRDRARFDLDRLRERRAVELAAAELGAHAAEQLAHREGLGDVVVGADLEPTTLSTSASFAVRTMIGTALRERTSRQMSSPLGPGIIMSRIRRS